MYNKATTAMKMFFILFLFVAFTSARPDDNVNVIPITCQHIRAFVDGHNSRRLLVANGKVADQPAALEMKKMVWDEELAAKASGWAKKNLAQHNPDNSVGSNRFSSGENLYWYSTTNPKHVLQVDAALESWFSEHVNYTFGMLDEKDFQRDYHIGHYTQMVWSDSVNLGCAISQTFKNGWNKYFVVCNYGPTGNYLGEKPYKECDRCSNKLVCGTENKCDRPYGANCENNPL